MHSSRNIKMFLAGIAVGCFAASNTVAQTWDLFTVSNTNELMRVSIPTTLPTTLFSATTIGVTQDANNGTIRRIRGLAWTGSTLYGMTREGDLVTVDPDTGVTVFQHSVAGTTGGGAGAGNQFWSDLAYDASSNSLYTVGAFGDRSLVRISLFGSITSAIQGPTQNSATGFLAQMLGVEFMSGMLLASNRSNQNIVEMNPATGTFTQTWPGTSGVPNAQQIALHPATGVLWAIHDHHSTSANNAALSTFDANFQSTEMGMLPFGIVETVGGGNDTYGWGGIVFVPAPGATSILALVGVVAMRRRR